jgi:hypothetical protein
MVWTRLNVASVEWYIGGMAGRWRSFHTCNNAFEGRMDVYTILSISEHGCAMYVAYRCDVDLAGRHLHL